MSASPSPVAIVGAGLSKFGRQPGVSGREMGLQAIRAALETPDWPGPTSRSPLAEATDRDWPTLWSATWG